MKEVTMDHVTGGGNAAFRNWHNDFAHIKDPNERRRLALAEVDKAKFGWYHVRAIAVAGAGFFTDAYDIFAVNLITGMLGLAFWKDGHIPQTADTTIKLGTSCGTIVGQLFFGWLSDQIGRKRIYGFELIIIIFATLAQALSSDSHSISVVGVITFWRVIMGIGIGGDYPMSSIITSEFATTKWRGAMIGSVFAMQGFGQLAAALVALVVTVAFKSQTSPANSYGECGTDCRQAVDRMWRLVVGLGAVPGCIALYYRLTIPETPRYTFDVAQDTLKGVADTEAYLDGRPEGHVDPVAQSVAIQQDAEVIDIPKGTWADFSHHFGQWKHLKILIGTAGSWFLLDVAFYGLGLNNSIILKAIGYSKKSNVYETLYNNAIGNVILICAGALPGYWLTVATVDTLGRKPIQLLGFTILTIFLAAIGFAFDKLKASPMTLLGMYIVCQFFFNFGPNATTFIVPGECFPTRYRSTAHGISAASGKLGAVFAQALIGPLRTRGATKDNDSPWLNHVMQIFALFMLAGLGTTLLIPETKERLSSNFHSNYMASRTDGYQTMLSAKAAAAHVKLVGTAILQQLSGHKLKLLRIRLNRPTYDKRTFALGVDE